MRRFRCEWHGPQTPDTSMLISELDMQILFDGDQEVIDWCKQAQPGDSTNKFGARPDSFTIERLV